MPQHTDKAPLKRPREPYVSLIKRQIIKTNAQGDNGVSENYEIFC